MKAFLFFVVVLVVFQGESAKPLPAVLSSSQVHIAIY